MYTTSLYEIELFKGKPLNDFFDSEKIKLINNAIYHVNNSDCVNIYLDNNAIPLYDLPDSSYNGLKHIEIFKLSRLYYLIKNGIEINFSITKKPIIHKIDKKNINNFVENKIDKISIEQYVNENDTYLDIRNKYINFSQDDILIDSNRLRNCYIKYDLYPISDKFNRDIDLAPFIIENGFEIGIVDTKKDIKIANAISSLLTRSVEYAKDSLGGYIPDKYVTNAQMEYVSPYAISNLWGLGGYRFVITQDIGNNIHKLIATILISNSRSNLFFFTNKFNNITINSLDKIMKTNSKWFDNFSFPNINNYYPFGFNQIANFAIEKNYRGNSLGSTIIKLLTKYYSSQYMQNNNIQIKHSQPLICGSGLFQISDPAWISRMTKMNFNIRFGSEVFFVKNNNNVPEKTMKNGKFISNVEYNTSMGLKIYDNNDYKNYIKHPEMILHDEINRVKTLTQSENAKWQYTQTYINFNDVVMKE